MVSKKAPALVVVLYALRGLASGMIASSNPKKDCLYCNKGFIADQLVELCGGGKGCRSWGFFNFVTSCCRL